MDKINAQISPVETGMSFHQEPIPGQNELIRTVASPNVLVTREDIPDDVVYNITKIIWENLATLTGNS